jgi:hypothetical protein
MYQVTLKIKNPTHTNTKLFQFNWVIWSNLYRGNVPLVAIAKTQSISTLINKIKYGIQVIAIYIT